MYRKLRRKFRNFFGTFLKPFGTCLEHLCATFRDQSFYYIIGTRYNIPERFRTYRQILRTSLERSSAHREIPKIYVDVIVLLLYFKIYFMLSVNVNI